MKEREVGRVYRFGKKEYVIEVEKDEDKRFDRIAREVFEGNE